MADGIIASVSRQYIDTRTQANISKLNADRKQVIDVVTEDMSNIFERRRNSGEILLFFLFICTEKKNQQRERTSYVFFFG